METEYDRVIPIDCTLHEYYNGDLILIDGLWWEVIYHVPDKLYVKRVRLTLFQRLRSLYHRVMASIKAFIHPHS